MKNFIYLLGLITIGIIIASCERETDNNNADFSEFTGQWEVIAYYDSTPIYGPFKVIILKNTPAGNDSITILDSEVKFWKFQVKALANKEDGTFETKLSNCEVSEESIGIKILNGKILDTDSIYFEIQFEDDETPFGHTYELKGHRISK